MAMRLVPRLSSSSFLADANDLHQCSSRRVGSTICASSRSSAYIPKLEPFSRSRLDRVARDPPLIQKAENELSDYCSTLEGDSSYGCWRAYFELKDLEKTTPKEEVERLIIESGGVKSLIGCLHGISAIHKGKKEETNGLIKETSNAVTKGERHCPVPDGLPKSREEMEEDEKARMLDSPYTRLLRARGRFPAWYSPAPDHETD
ncbi:hypothetical protein RJ640_016489 [Escallonia rubra]|uniref:CCG-binding protein 1 n=1 Tax=Escallonia rubra TaxID=112253 RepID=A0AA88R011_9ASTE|nr:hypothetical protein RJ640_016489 [Escallonia rubra]